MIRHVLVSLLALSACNGESDNLVSDADIVGDALPVALTGVAGDSVRGKTLFADREGAHCVLCHKIEDLDALFQGDVGPDLTSVGNRLTNAQIRLRIVDYERVKPGVTMPSYYRLHGLNQVGKAYLGQPALTAQNVEDIVTYLGNLENGPDA